MEETIAYNLKVIEKLPMPRRCGHCNRRRQVFLVEQQYPRATFNSQLCRDCCTRERVHMEAQEKRRQEQLTGECHFCGQEIGTTAGVKLEFAIPVEGKPNSWTVEKRWVHTFRQDCDNVSRAQCPEHRGHYYAVEGGEGCPICTEIWSV